MAQSESTPSVDVGGLAVGILPAAGVVLLLGLVWIWLPNVAFLVAFAGQFATFFVLFLLSNERQVSPRGGAPTGSRYPEGGIADAIVDVVAPDADEDRRRAVVQTTYAFLISLFVGCVLLTFFGARLADALGSVAG